jgi:hypothetical protein
MLEQLFEKILSFDENQLEFNNPSKLHFNGATKKFALEWTDTGCYIIEKDLIKFVDYSLGRTFQLDKNWVLGDWNLYRNLYLKIWNNKEIRIDPPIIREELTINGEVWEYTEFSRPWTGNGEWGFLGTDEKVFLAGLQQDFYNLIKNAKEVATEHNTAGIPMFSIGSRNKDAEGFYFVKDFKGWNNDVSEVVRWALIGFKILVFYIISDPSLAQEEYKNAKILWESLL